MNASRILLSSAAALTMIAVGVTGFTSSDSSATTTGAVERSMSAAAFTVDAAHSSAVFRIKHMDTAFFYGRFNKIAGAFKLDPENPSASELNVIIETASVDTGNKGRDEHIRSNDFFSASQFPQATFSSTSIERAGPDTYKVTGDLTVKGKSKSVTVEVKHTGSNTNRGGKQISGIESIFTINRSDFGIDYMPQGLGEEVKMMISLEGVAE